MTTKHGKILAVDDNEDVLLALRLFLKQHFAAVQTEEDPRSLPALLKAEDFDVILLDMNLSEDVTSGQEGLYWLNRILEINPAAIMIMITAYAELDLAVRAIKEGATDFIAKPWENQKLLATVSSALALRQSQRQVEDLRQRQRRFSPLINPRPLAV